MSLLKGEGFGPFFIEREEEGSEGKRRVWGCEGVSWVWRAGPKVHTYGVRTRVGFCLHDRIYGSMEVTMDPMLIHDDALSMDFPLFSLELVDCFFYFLFWFF